MMPLFGIAVFWFWPLSVAVPVYGVITLISILIYFAIIRATGRPVQTGMEGLMYEVAEVIEPVKPEGLVIVKGEIWKAASSDHLYKGDCVKVVGINGLTLNVQRILNNYHAGHPNKHCRINKKHFKHLEK
jgi:membrane-bound serine protease (ClpP class)